MLTYNRKALLCLACVFALLSCASIESRKSKSLAKIDKALARKYQKGKAPNYFWHNDRNYVWDIGKSKYKNMRGKAKVSKKEITKTQKAPSSRLNALKKMAPLLAEEYQNANKEPPTFLRHGAQSYAWDIGALDYHPLKEKAELEALPLSPKLQALKKIDPLLVEKYQKGKKEPPDSLSHKSQNYLWNPDTLSYGLVKEKAKPKSALLSPKLQALKKIDSLLAENTKSERERFRMS